MCWPTRQRTGSNSESSVGSSKVDLPEAKTLEAFDFNFQPKLDKRLVLELAELQFVLRAEDLLITGQPGTGKSHMCSRLSRSAHAKGR